MISTLFGCFYSSWARAREGTVATAAIIDNLDPDKTSGSGAALYVDNVFDTLLAFNHTPSDGHGRYVPALATSWTVSLDGTSLEFTIRDDAFFHDGTKVTPEDVKFSMNRLIDPETHDPYRGSHFSYITATETVGANKVIIHLSKPFAGMLDALAAYGYIVPQKYIENVGNAEFAKKPVGSGPFEVASYRPGDRVIFKAFDKYWGSKAYYDTLNWLAIPDTNTRISLLLSGEADAITDIPSSLADVVRNGGGQVKVLRGQNQRFLIINAVRPGPLSDPRVRLALNLAIDRNALIHALFGTNVPLLNGPLSAGQLGADAVSPYPFDPQKAKQLLADAGYAKGFSTDLIYTPGRYIDDGEMIPILVSFWKQIGVSVTPKATEYNQWLTMPGKRVFNGLESFSKGVGVVSDPLSAFSRHIACDGYYSAYCNKDLDNLLKSSESVVDESKLKEIFSKAQQIAHDDAAQVFLFDQPAIMGLRKGLTWNSEYQAGDLATSWLPLGGPH
jgi:peptide/nickel transport system substrate-binding protein